MDAVANFIVQNNCRMKCVTAVTGDMMMNVSSEDVQHIVISETLKHVGEFLKANKSDKEGNPSFIEVRDGIFTNTTEYEAELFIFTPEELSKLIHLVNGVGK